MNPYVTPRVTIVIPTFNKYELTQQCLKGLEGSTEVPFTVILVDNASADGTAARTEKEFPDVRVISMKENVNFSGACNFGASLATTELIVFLNNDTVPFKGWLEPLVEELDNPEVGIVGSKLVFPDGTLQHAGVCFMRETRFPYHPYRGMDAETPAANHRRELQVVTGACFAIRKADFFAWGQFNNQYKNGGEDIELCLIARRHGKKVVYNPESVLIHYESQSPGRLDHNDANVRIFFENFPHQLLSDEDAFYYEDGFYRLKRNDISRIDLRPFTGDEERLQYKNVSDMQLEFATSTFGTGRYASVPVDAWPTDADLHEWVGLIADRGGFYSSASGHFKEALLLQKTTARNEALKTINSAVFLNPQFNRFFAKV